MVLENGSGDDSDAVLRDHFSREPFRAVVTYLASETNLGFCGGVNLAVDAALAAEPKPEYVWMLNPDIFPPEGLLAELLAVSRESGCEVVPPRAGEHMAFSGEERWPLPYFAPGFTWKTKPQLDRRWWRTGRYHGGCVLMPTWLVERLIARDGEFQHEPLFMYWDEWDTSIRAAKLGATFAVANVGVQHYTHDRNSLSGLMEARLYYSARNSMLMGHRHFRWWLRPLVMPLQAARGTLYYCGLKGSPWRPYIRGLVDGLRGKHGLWDRHPG